MDVELVDPDPGDVDVLGEVKVDKVVFSLEAGHRAPRHLGGGDCTGRGAVRKGGAGPETICKLFRSYLIGINTLISFALILAKSIEKDSFNAGV